MSLSAGQMARLSHLLEEALALDEQGRRRWLEGLTDAQRDLEPALRRALLPQMSPAIDALATLPKLALEQAKKGLGRDLQAGTRVGPYELIRPLGEGGMAEVWLAQRADGAYRRQLALKLLTALDLREDIAKRFARERDILAALEHPNIARFYDAGVSQGALPYLAMEYVQGEPLIQWCDAHRAAVNDRLRLFLQVLDAVQYAHARKVLHRDIKPSNILVTNAGQVRLLDFGVAKLLAEDDAQTQLTQLYGRALTPDYASPEMIRGDPLEAASDVYALGVVLYELLSGSRPYRLKSGASLLALARALMKVQVPRPSTQVTEEAATARATTIRKLSRGLRGDLDAIVFKALERNFRDRYASAQALSDDLRRYLSKDPVIARSAHAAYLLSKFLIRNRRGIAVTVIVLSILALALDYALTRQG